MKKILIFDNTFPCPQPNKKAHTQPTKFTWEWAASSINYTSEQKKVVVYTDDCIPTANFIGQTNIALLLEPEEFIPTIYAWIRANYRKFSYILTWDKKLLELDKRFVFYPLGNSWLFEDQFQIYPKSQMTSIVASWKNFLLGHKLRHAIITKYMQPYGLHWFGKRGFEPEKNMIMPFDPTVQNPIEELVDAYKDYRFTIIVENEFTEHMFTEKIISPFLAGTVPIYWGCPSISNFFNEKGMLIFNSVEELDVILNKLTPEIYEEMLPYVKENFITAHKYKSLPDSIFDVLSTLGLT